MFTLLINPFLGFLFLILQWIIAMGETITLALAKVIGG